jgi:DNA polymerase I-like protein with 3'-5' exonuclease and polymerase domains
MIHFIINRPHEVIPEEGELLIKSTLEQEDIDFICNSPILGFDYEANSLDPYIADPILMIIGNEERQYVIDCLSYPCDLLLAFLPEDKLILGANLKYDYKIAKVKHKHTFAKMFDVMIAEQRLLQGITEFNVKRNKIVSISCSLESITSRRLGKLPDGMDKVVRNEFIGANPKTFIFRNKHIKYGAADIKPLFDIRTKQKEDIRKYNQDFLIYAIEFPLIREVADAELEGFIINESKWIENIIYNKEKKFEYQCKLDIELRRLRDTLLPKEERGYLSNGVWDRERKKEVKVVQSELFGALEFETIIPSVATKKKSKQKDKDPYINYSSPVQLVYMFGRLKEALPTKKGNFAVPTFSYNTVKKREVINKDHAFTTGEGAIESYLTENPGTKIDEFVRLLIKYREHTTRLNTFGEGFLVKFKNPVTGKFHTIFRQCEAVTGRFQSGDKKNGWFNCQNIPAEKKYREAFCVEEGYNVSTTDLSGAEAVIMIDQARDEKFYQIAIVNDDAHSPLATAVWRAIGMYRLETWSNTVQKWKKSDGTYIIKTPQELAVINISKNENKEIRTEFKNTTFASIYGCYPKKYAKMINISIEEAKIGLSVMKSSIPKTFKMVEQNSWLALNNGWLVINPRTNSRIWYDDVLKAKRNNCDLDFRTSSDISGSARNCRIQGTQADMIKEAIVEIGKEIRRQKLDAKFLIQVHDELVYKFHNSIKEVEFLNEVTKLVEMVSFGEFIKKWMCQVGNRYLSFIKITAEEHTGLTWTK